MLKAVRVYQVNIRENILRQVIFTDRNLFLALCILPIFLIWNLGRDLSTDLKFFSSLFLCGLILLVFSLKSDRQPVYLLMPRILAYLILPKCYSN